MKTILMSLKESVYKKVLSGEKIFEHRKVFPDGPIKAYIYVSAPVKAICGIMYLNNKTSLLKLKEKYDYDESCIERIDNYLIRYNYVMQIERFKHTKPIELNKLRSELSKFVVPQMYYYIDDTELLRYLDKNLIFDGVEIKNSFNHITSDMICVN